MFSQLISEMRNLAWGFPLLAFVVGTGVATTVGLSFIQFRKFLKSWSLVLGKAEGATAATRGELSPMQAFLNALSTGLGNGSIAGIAVAIHTGGPGAAFWIFFVGLLSMVLRFSEVFLATSFSSFSSTGRVLSGPFLYLARVPGGKILPTVYALFCLAYSFSGGDAMQCNSISTVFSGTLGVPVWLSGAILTGFVVYVLLGGAQRIIRVSTYLVPLKVGAFFIFCSGVLIYHWASIIPAIFLIIKSAFSPKSVLGAACGISVQHIFGLSLVRVLNASEAGLGTAAVIYGSTGSKNPMNEGIVSMLSVFISTNLVCTMIALSIVASGVWNSGANGSALTALAFSSVFGALGGWVVALLTVLFGIGVFVTHSFVARQCWLFLTNDRYETLFMILFAGCAFWGSTAAVSVVWDAIDLVVAGLLVLNTFGLLWLLPYVRGQVMPLLKKDA